MSKLETLLHGHVDFRSTNEAEDRHFPFKHKCSSPVVRWRMLESSSVCVHMRGMSVSVSKLETLLRGDVDFRSTNEVEVDRRFPLDRKGS